MEIMEQKIIFGHHKQSTQYMNVDDKSKNFSYVHEQKWTDGSGVQNGRQN